MQKAEVPDAGDWVVIRDYGLNYRQIDKVTPKFLKLGAGSNRYPTQIGRDDSKIICCIRGEATLVAKIRDSIAGVEGEFKRRQSEAKSAYSERVSAARVVRDKAVTRLITKATSNG